MAKVVITIEDSTGPDGEEGVTLDIESDPEFPQNDDDQTVAQSWATGLLDMMVGAAGNVRFDSDKYPVPSGDGSSQTH